MNPSKQQIKNVKRTIKQWELIRDKGYTKGKALISMRVKNMPFADCFLCESFGKHIDNFKCSRNKIPCPLNKSGLKCSHLKSPWEQYKEDCQKNQ